ncbi:MAG: ABC transporter permease, partial [Verrucomicrobiales bacterium]
VLTMGPPEKRIMNAIALPSIKETVQSFPSLWFERELSRGALVSLGRVLGGFFLASIIALPLGVLSGAYPMINAFLRPVSILGRNVPIAALVGLAMFWFGIGETQKIMFVFMATAAFILFDSTHAVEGVSDRFLDTAYTLGAKKDTRGGAIKAAVIGVIYALLVAFALSLLSTSDQGLGDRLASGKFWITAGVGWVIGFLLWFPILGHQVISKVMLPLALPNITNSLRLLFGLAFGYIMLVEMVHAQAGLGHIINMSQKRGPREHVYLCIIIIALLAFVIDRVALWLQHRLFPYVHHVEN